MRLNSGVKLHPQVEFGLSGSTLTYWRTRKTLQTGEASMSLLASLSMITQVTLISPRSLGSLNYTDLTHEMRTFAVWL